MHEDEQTQTPAEAARRLAEARAEAVALDAEARVRALIDGRSRRAEQPADPPPAVDLAPLLSRLEQTAKDYIAEHLPLTEVYREAVSIRAYYKAEQRQFAPGGEGEDWAEAEQDVLDTPPFGDPAAAAD